MRRVACYSVSSALAPSEAPSVAMESIVNAIGQWLQGKGLEVLPADAALFVLPNGREAMLTVASASHEIDIAKDFVLEEPTEGGRFVTRVCVGSSGGRIYLFVELRAGNDALKVRPVPIDAYCPRVLQEILKLREWFVGETPVHTAPIRFDGQAGAHALMRIVRHTDRNLPIVTLSRVNGTPFSPTLAEDLAQDLSGLAIVTTVDQSASLELSSEYGREWSCYNQAVRLYWPLRATAVNAFEHPLWTVERLLAYSGDVEYAAGRLRRQLRRQLLAISTYTVSEPTPLMRVFSEAADRRLQNLRQSARTAEDWEKLALDQDERIKTLQRDLNDKQEELEHLQARVDSLSVAIRYMKPVDDGEEIPPDSAPNVQTVADAVESAGRLLADDLVFGDDVPDGVCSLAPDAGPPDKVYENLRVLAAMTRQRRETGLGKDQLIWLAEQGLQATSESETVLNSKSEMKKRTWGDGNGGVRQFEQHLKPNKATSPDRCVRIYFAFDDQLKKTIVGWVGRHP